MGKVDLLIGIIDAVGKPTVRGQFYADEAVLHVDKLCQLTEIVLTGLAVHIPHGEVRGIMAGHFALVRVGGVLGQYQRTAVLGDLFIKGNGGIGGIQLRPLKEMYLRNGIHKAGFEHFSTNDKGGVQAGEFSGHGIHPFCGGD